MNKSIKSIGIMLASLLITSCFVMNSSAALIVFGQSGGQAFPFSATNDGALVDATTTLAVTNANVTVTEWIFGGPIFNAFFNLQAVSDSPAVPIGLGVLQYFSGSFSITSLANGGGVNYLSGTFTDVLVGNDGLMGSGAFGAFSLQSSDPPTGALTFTSSIVPPNALLTPRSFTLGLSGLTTNVGITNGSLSSFSANFSGNADAGQEGLVVPLPEPASMAIWGIGALGMAFAGYRRRKLIA